MSQTQPSSNQATHPSRCSSLSAISMSFPRVSSTLSVSTTLPTQTSPFLSWGRLDTRCKERRTKKKMSNWHWICWNLGHLSYHRHRWPITRVLATTWTTISRSPHRLSLGIAGLLRRKNNNLCRVHLFNTSNPQHLSTTTTTSITAFHLTFIRLHLLILFLFSLLRRGAV